jgi:hypothetical protein
MRSVRNLRTGNQDQNSTGAKGDRFQELTCIWRSTVSTLPVEDLNIVNDNYTVGTPIDHSPDSELGIIQTKGKFYDSISRYWSFGGLEREWKKKYDHMICYCANKDGTLIERIYIFPVKEIKDKRVCITIVKNPSKGYPWYEEYRIKDEETIKKINEIWKKIIVSKKKKNRDC